jgi:hypothetical protein
VLQQRALKVSQTFFKQALEQYAQQGVDAARTMAVRFLNTILMRRRRECRRPVASVLSS